jgi:hypothetical protein
MSCWDKLGVIIAWEADDPDLAREHFLTVASYNLQHPAQFNAPVLDGLWNAFCQHLDQGLPVAEIRKQVGKSTQGATRVLKPASERHPVLRNWTMTIADVYSLGQPEGVVHRVRAWAATIRRERA